MTRWWLPFAPLLAATPALAAPLTVTVTDAQGQPLAGAVAYVDVKGARRSAEPGTRATLAQRERQFDPRVLVVQTGTAVNFPNFDTVRHHVYSFSPVKPFEIKLYAGTPSEPVLFDKPGVAVLGCNIHDRMVAHVVVVDTPHFGRTDAAGQVVLQVPAGEHELRVWHPGMAPDTVPAPRPQRVADAGAAVAVRLAP